MKYYLDTNIIVYALNGKYPAVERHFQSVPAMSIAVPSIVLAEIEYGARKSRDYAKTIAQYRKFTGIFEPVPFSDAASVCYGKIRAELEEQGQVIGADDMLIAATALADESVLVTHNVGEFSRIEGLKVEDWTE